jgi:peptidoglycan/LPS O-acetylase OafA/YrhL
MPASDRVQELDGVRGIAILLVLIFHLFSSSVTQAVPARSLLAGPIDLAWCGVDLFFVLSGFLITGVLLDTKGAQNYFRAFYWRRALRILPLYYLVLAAYLLLQALKWWRGPAGRAWPALLGTEQIYYWFYLSNWRTAFAPLRFPAISHFWSLAIEEQFYIVWPAVVLFCTRRQLVAVCCCAIAGCCVLRNLPLFQHLNLSYTGFLYGLTPFRIDTLLFGAGCALIARDAHWSECARRYLWAALAGGCAGLLWVVLAAGSTSAFTPEMTGFGYTVLGLIFASLITFAQLYSGANRLVPAILRNRVLRSFGKYSYCMYLIHVFIIRLPLLNCGILFGAILKISLTYGVAFISWNVFEKRFLGEKMRIPYHWVLAAKGA